MGVHRELGAMGAGLALGALALGSTLKLSIPFTLLLTQGRYSSLHWLPGLGEGCSYPLPCVFSFVLYPRGTGAPLSSVILGARDGVFLHSCSNGCFLVWA